MSEYSFKENEYLVVGWAQGLMDTEEEDANGKKVNVQRPYYQLFVLSPVSSYKSDTYTASGLTGNLSINGSTSVGPVMMELAEAYMNLNSGVTIDVQQTGSGAGITATMDGSCEIGMSSRDLKEEELAEGLTPVKIAMDGIAVIVNEANPVTGLTTEQIRNIFLGNTTNWSELG